MGMALVAERAGTGVPPEVVQFIACRRQISPADDLPVRGRLGVAVDHGHRIALAAGRIERCDVGQVLGRSRDRGGRRAIERGVSTLGHRNLPHGIRRRGDSTPDRRTSTSGAPCPLASEEMSVLRRRAKIFEANRIWFVQ
jgi:hypothetical protein